VSRARDVVEVIVHALVERPQEARVVERSHQGTTIVEVAVADSDLGRVIGRQGRTAAAIRTLAGATAETEGQRVKVDILEPDERR
jgi:predicted RNA-binding protein YlqC (UPF0109 family)